METVIDLTIKAKIKHSKPINKLLESLVSGDKESVSESINKIGEGAVEKYTAILSSEYYSNYLSYFEYLNGCVHNKKGGINLLNITTSGLGFEFAVAFVDLLGPYCEELAANVTHDDDEGHIPVKITYRNGAVYADGDEGSVSTFEEEEIDLWVVEPILDKDILTPIYILSKKASEKDSFSDLAQLYIDLFKPIIAIAKMHDLLDDLLSEDDEQEYLEYIDAVLKLDIHKNNHPVILLFKNKMFENLEKISSVKYFGSIFQEYKKTLLVFYTIVDLHSEGSDGTFEEFFEDVIDQDEFDLVYEIMSLLEFA